MPLRLDDATSIDEIYHRVRGNALSPRIDAVVRPAAAGILWRRRGASFQVYLVKRSSSLAFAAGQWSFPGGVVEAVDGLVAGQPVTRATYIRALRRELSEEIGSSLPHVPDALFVSQGHYVTPAVSPIRYDAHYLAVPVGTEVVFDPAASGGELADGQWMEPKAALQAWRTGTLALPSPVRAALDVLARADGHPGQPGANPSESRGIAAAERENALAIWDVVPGVGVLPLRSPTLPPATHTNCYVLGHERLVLVDPGADDPTELALLCSALDGYLAQGKVLNEIWLTHHHGDHVAGAAWLAQARGVPVRAHPATAERLAGRVPVIGDLVEGSLFRGGDGHCLRALLTPGHAPGHLCFLDEGTRAVVCGDMVAGVGTILIDSSEGDMTAYLASLRRLEELNCNVLLPAHGSSIPEPNERLRGYVAHRLWREAKVVQSLLSVGPSTIERLVGVAYSDVASAIHPIAARSLGAHLNKLVADGVVSASGNEFSLVTASASIPQ